MNKNKFTFLVVTLAALLISVPQFSNAQSAPSIGANELRAQKNLDDAARAELKTNPAGGNALGTAMNGCMNLGVRTFTITRGKYSTIWLSGESACAFGEVVSGGESDPFGRNYSVKIDNGFNSYMIAMREGAPNPALTQATYDTHFKSKETTTDANGVAWWDKVINFLVVSLANILGTIIAGIGALAMWILNTVLDNTTGDLRRPGIVAFAWEYIRDLVNLFFIIALIAMALGTILRREEYNYKRLLGQLIFMAILVNFSAAIANTLIMFSDYLINLFRPLERDWTSSFSTLYKGFITGGNGLTGFIGADTTWTDGIGQSVVKLIGLTIFTVSVLMIAGLMFVRMVGLWFLVMVSPVAYGLNILPQTKKYSEQWWNLFIKYLTWGPIAMFFLSLTFRFIREVGGGNYASNDTFNYLVISAFLWMGFMAAKGTGMIAAGTVTGYADKALSKARGYGMSTVRGIGAGAGAGSWALAKYTGRGSAIKDLGKFTGSTRMQAFGEGMERVTAKVQAIPPAKVKGMKYKYWDKPGADRKKFIEAEKRKYQLVQNYLGDLDKDTAAGVSNVDILTLSNKKVGDSSGLNMAKVDNILEHGKKGSKDALVYAYHQGLLKMDEANQEEYHQVVDAINEYAYRKGGGRGEMPDDFDVKKNVTVVYKGDAKKPDANAETKIKNMYVNVKIKKDGTTTSETKTETKVQPSSDPSLEKEGSGSERQERRKALAGDALNKDKKS